MVFSHVIYPQINTNILNVYTSEIVSSQLCFHESMFVCSELPSNLC